MTRILSILLFYAAANAGCGNVPLNPAYDCTLSHNQTIRIVNFWDVDGMCRPFSPQTKPRIWACHYDRTIIIPKVGTGGIDLSCQQRIFRHEHEHACGWPADHPGGRYE